MFETTGVINWWDSSGWGGPEAEKTAKQTESTYSWGYATQGCDTRGIQWKLRRAQPPSGELRSRIASSGAPIAEVLGS